MRLYLNDPNVTKRIGLSMTAFVEELDCVEFIVTWCSFVTIHGYFLLTEMCTEAMQSFSSFFSVLSWWDLIVDPRLFCKCL